MRLRVPRAFHSQSQSPNPPPVYAMVSIKYNFHLFSSLEHSICGPPPNYAMASIKSNVFKVGKKLSHGPAPNYAMVSIKICLNVHNNRAV